MKCEMTDRNKRENPNRLFAFVIVNMSYDKFCKSIVHLPICLRDRISISNKATIKFFSADILRKLEPFSWASSSSSSSASSYCHRLHRPEPMCMQRILCFMRNDFVVFISLLRVSCIMAAWRIDSGRIGEI